MSDIEDLEDLVDEMDISQHPKDAIPIDEEEEDDDSIQAVKKYKKADTKTDNRCKGKKERTQGQKDAWARCLAKRAEQRNARKEHLSKEVAEREGASKVRLEKKIVKKAVKVKKNKIVEQLIDEDTSDSEIDDIDVESIKKLVQQRRAIKKAKRQTTPNPPQQKTFEKVSQNEFESSRKETASYSFF